MVPSSGVHSETVGCLRSHDLGHAALLDVLNVTVRETDPPDIVALFKRVDTTAFDKQGFDPEKKGQVKDAKPRIRCPHCKWQPEKSSRWFCAPMGAPEHFNGGCGTRWNTFDTGGKCPGCQYQWVHTSCLACEKTALHEDWYEKEGNRQ